ncbi:MAG: hypothetical protein ACLQU3_08510 [Limisphaerales bacterium]
MKNKYRMFRSGKSGYYYWQDISRFKPKAACHEFVADLPSPFARRYAARVTGVDYRPDVRFSL